MDKKSIETALTEFVRTSPGNYISEDYALRPELVGIRMFADPIFAYGAADDPLFERMKTPGIIGPHYITPTEWMPEAKTVISVFYPMSEQVWESNVEKYPDPSDEWLHARIEGQQFLTSANMFLKDYIEKNGEKALVAFKDPRYKDWTKPSKTDLQFTSNWSERHAAYICGLGTFGLSKGIITEKGTCGRFGSVITSLELEPTKRRYTEVYEYCNMCGMCAKQCPSRAIDVQKGKDKSVCAEYIGSNEERFYPRYGCGKCQVNVPCSRGIPKKSR